MRVPLQALLLCHVVIAVVGVAAGGCSSSSESQTSPPPHATAADKRAAPPEPEAPSASTSAAPSVNTPTVNAPAAGARPTGIIAGSPPAALSRAPHRVVLLTFDGVRPVDLLRATSGDKPLMPTLAALKSASLVVGLDDGERGASTPARVPLSLPGYRTLMEGHVSACLDNGCPRTAEETLLERVAAVYPRQGVGVFASWAGIHRAASHRDGDDPLVDAPVMGAPETSERPWPDARLDRKTAAAALAHLKATWPPLLWVALLDTDEWAHLGDRAKTDAALAAADGHLGELLRTLKDAPEQQRRPTTILITTDHGRGPGDAWPHHKARDGSEQIFIIAHGPQVKPATSSTLGELSLADVRPTVERLLNVCSAACAAEGCGRPIPEVLGDRAALNQLCRRPGATAPRVPTLR
jgi:hypothetical protein